MNYDDGVKARLKEFGISDISGFPSWASFPLNTPITINSVVASSNGKAGWRSVQLRTSYIKLSENHNGDGSYYDAGAKLFCKLK